MIAYLAIALSCTGGGNSVFMMSNSCIESNKRLKTAESIRGGSPLQPPNAPRSKDCSTADNHTTDALSLSVDEMANVFGFLGWREILPARVCKVSVIVLRCRNFYCLCAVLIFVSYISNTNVSYVADRNGRMQLLVQMFLLPAGNTVDSA